MRLATRLAGLLILQLGLGSECVAAELLGTVIPPLPSGMFKGVGACIGKTDATLCERSIGILKNAEGKDFLIYAGSAEPRQGKEARWKVTDTLAFPTLPKGYELVFGVCRTSGNPDPSIVAVVRNHTSREWLRARDWAYRVDFDTSKFTKLEPDHIDCANPALEWED